MKKQEKIPKNEKNPENRGKMNEKQASPEAIFKMKKEKFKKKFASASLEGVAEF
jgi:hypothetical protein